MTLWTDCHAGSCVKIRHLSHKVQRRVLRLAEPLVRSLPPRVVSLLTDVEVSPPRHPQIPGVLLASRTQAISRKVAHYALRQDTCNQ